MDLPLVVDPATLEMISAEEPPAGWHQRRLYLGDEAARRWMAVGAEQDFRRPIGRLERGLFGSGRARSRRLAEALLRSVEIPRRWRSFVSLGPGDARMDLDLVRELDAGEPGMDYVAVDVSDVLLRRAMERLAEVSGSVLGILGDFESRFDFIEGELRTRCDGPRLFALLGNTLGNLDRCERAFLERISVSLDERDGLLLSVSTKGPRWSVEVEPLLGPAGYSERVQSFLGVGLRSSATRPAGFETSVRFEKGRSDVPRASAVDLIDAARDEPLISVRRYDWRALVAWLQEELLLEVVFQEEVVFDDVEGAGVVLVRRSG